MTDDPVDNANAPKIFELLAALAQRMQEGFEMLTKEQQALRNDQHAISNRMEEGFAASVQDYQGLNKRMEGGFAVVTQEQQALSKRMEEGFAVVTQEQQALGNTQQALSKRMEEGFVVVTQEQQALGNTQQALSKRMEEGLAMSAQEYQALANKLDEHVKWLIKELPEDVSILTKMIQEARQESAVFHSQAVKLQDFQKFLEEHQKFQEKTVEFQNAVKEDFGHYRRVLEKSEQIFVSHEEFKKEKAAQVAVDKNFDQRITRLEAA